MLKEQINDDLKNALKRGDAFTVSVLRVVNSSLQNKSIEKRGKGGPGELSDEEVIEVLAKEVKKRREAADIYKQGSRLDLAEKEEKEAVVIQKYLPEQLSREEVEKIIDETLAESKPANIGEAMKLIMPKLKGRADTKIASQIIQTKFKG